MRLFSSSSVLEEKKIIIIRIINKIACGILSHCSHNAQQLLGGDRPTAVLQERGLLGRPGPPSPEVIQYEEFVILVKLDIKKLVDLVKLIECLFKFSSLYLL